MSIDYLRKKLANWAHPWEEGSGDSALERHSDGALLCFIVYPGIGILVTYQRKSRPLVYSPLPITSETVSRYLGGDQMKMCRTWFVGLEDTLVLVQKFFDGEHFTEGRNWCEFLVNTSTATIARLERSMVEAEERKALGIMQLKPKVRILSDEELKESVRRRRKEAKKGR